MDQNKKENIDLQAFVDKLYSEKKYPSDLEKEVVDQIKADLLSGVEDRINAIIINNLAEDKLEEFSNMIDGDISDEEVQKFCAENIPDLEERIAAELIIFQREYLS